MGGVFPVALRNAPKSHTEMGQYFFYLYVGEHLWAIEIRPQKNMGERRTVQRCRAHQPRWPVRLMRMVYRGANRFKVLDPEEGLYVSCKGPDTTWPFLNVYGSKCMSPRGLVRRIGRSTAQMLMTLSSSGAIPRATSSSMTLPFLASACATARR